MAKVLYKPDQKAECPSVTILFGYEFEAGKPVEVEDGTALVKFRGHPFFEVLGPTCVSSESSRQPDGNDSSLSFLGAAWQRLKSSL